VADLTRSYKGSGFGPTVVGNSVKLEASASVYALCMVFVNASGYAVGSVSAATVACFCAGVASRDVSNASGSQGAVSVDLHDFFYLDNDTTNPITIADLNRSYCYAVDNHTVGRSSVGGSLLLAGVPVAIDAAGKIAVRFNTSGALAGAFAESPYLGTSSDLDFTAHVVATNLAALTFTGGTFTADANGALATQDGITVAASGIAAGDVIIFPTGTITTGVVSAANSGPWLLTSVGGASAKFTGIRPDWYRHGASMSPHPIRVAAGTLFANTDWKPYADVLVSGTPLVIGTGDPKFRPVQVTQTVTLSSSAATITNVPIHSATRSNVHAALGAVGGTTTSTIGYGIIVAPTPGDLGTASTVVNAIASGGTKNGTSDTSILIVTITNG
jgi:hypothetical protein